MDPVLPEIILNEEEQHDGTQSGFSYFYPHYHAHFVANGSASQDERAAHQVVELSILTSQQITTQVQQFCPSATHLAVAGTSSQGAPTVAEMPSMADNSDQGAGALSWMQEGSNLQHEQHRSQSLTGPTEPQTQAPDSLAPPNQQAVSPLTSPPLVLTPHQPALICSPCSPPHSWFNMNPVAATTHCGCNCSYSVLFPLASPSGCWYNPHSPPDSVVLLHEVDPSCCLCSQAAPVLQPCSPDQDLRRAAQQVREELSSTTESEASGRKTNEEQAKAEEEQQRNYTDDKNKLQDNYADHGRAKTEDSLGSSASLDEELLAERAFEEYMAIMDSLGLQIQEDKTENEDGKDEEKKRQEVKKVSFLKYLNELCSDEDFVTEVESILDKEFLDSLISSDQEPVDHLPLEKQEQEERQPSPNQPLEKLLQQQSHPPSADSTSEAPVAEETSPSPSHADAQLQRAQSLMSDPPGTQSDTDPNQEGPNAPLSVGNIGSKEDSTSCSPVGSVREEHLPTGATTASYNPVNSTTLHHDGLLSIERSLDLLRLAPILLRSSLEQETKELEEPAALVPTEDMSEEASKSFSNPADTHSAQTSQTLQGEAGPAAESSSVSRVSGQTEDPRAIDVNDPVPDPVGHQAPTVCASPPAQIRELDEQSGPEEKKLKSSFLEDHTVPVAASSSSHAESCDPRVGANLSDLVPEEQTAEPPKGSQASPVSPSSIEQGDMDRKCEKNPGKGVTTATKATEEVRSKGIFERGERRKQKKTKRKGRTNKVHVRRSQQPLDQLENERARLLNGGNEPSEMSIEKTEKFIHERDVESHEKQNRWSSEGRQLPESYFKELRRASEQFLDTGEQEHGQNLAGEMQELKMEEGGQCEAKKPRVSAETEVENVPQTQTAQEEEDLGEESVRTKEEESETPRIVGKTRRTKTGKKAQPVSFPATRARKKIQHKIKASSERETHENNKQDEVSGVYLTESCLQSPRVQTDTHPTKDDEGGQESCTKNPILTSTLPRETQRRRKTFKDSKGSVTRTKNLNFYLLRSQTQKPNVPNGTHTENKAVEATRHPSNPKPNPDQTAVAKGDDETINGEEAQRSGLMLSPMKRSWHERGETEAKNETDTISVSPPKRGRWRRRHKK